MKNKLLFQITTVLMMSSFLISCNKKEDATNDYSPEKAVKTLSELGAELGAATQKNPISPEHESLISTLANTPIPIPKFIKENAILATGTNFLTLEPIILNSLTGNVVKACGKVGIIDTNDPEQQNSQSCIQILDPTDSLRSALRITSPIDGKILNKGKPTDARIVVKVSVFYEGSECETTIIDGTGYEECVPPRPHRSR